MTLFYSLLALSTLVVCTMWIYELWDILNEHIESHRPICECSAAKSDARATSADEARAVATGMLKRLNLRTATRYDIDLALNKMAPDGKAEAKRLLNYYRTAK